MPTKLKKPVTRSTEATVRDGGAPRNIIVTLYPNGVLGLRLARSRREETVGLDHVYLFAVKLRVLGKEKQ